MILNQMAIEYGSTLQGRQDAARVLLSISHTPPIYIHEDLIFISTRSLRHPNCILINTTLIDNIKEIAHKTRVTFVDQTTLDIDITIKLFRVRWKQARELSTRLNRLRKKESVYSIVNY